MYEARNVRGSHYRDVISSFRHRVDKRREAVWVCGFFLESIGLGVHVGSLDRGITMHDGGVSGAGFVRRK